ncbi:MAG: hypothetical protein QW057_04655 [Candidatus Bathyarchaeia archaeon]
MKSAFGSLTLCGIIMGVLIFSAFAGGVPWSIVQPVRVAAAPLYEYYGYAPPSNFSGLDADPGAGPNFRYGWVINQSTGYFIKDYGQVDNGTCYLFVIGYNDSTNVQVWDITRPEPVLRESFQVNRMGVVNKTARADNVYNTTIPSKTYFKVVADKPVAVMVGGGWNFGYGFDLFYPSTDGGYVGQEFIFMAIYNRGRGERPAPGGTIFALEDAKVTVYDNKSAVYWEREMKANTSRTVAFLSGAVYRVVSTGRIMVATWSQWTVKAVPAPLGGFRGTYFFVYQDAGPHTTVERVAMIIVNQEKASHVKVVDTTNDQTMTEKDLSPHGVWFLTSQEADFMNKPVMVKSTNDVVVLSGTTYSMNPTPTNMFPDVTVVGVRANTPTTLYVISKAVAFSPRATARVSIGAVTLTIPQGRYAELPTGLITVNSNSTLIVEIISQPSTTYPTSGDPVPLNPVALDSWGTYLLTADGAELTYPPPKPSGGMDVMLYGAVGGAVAVIAVVAVVFMRRSRKR